jgi:hypothetical protein
MKTFEKIIGYNYESTTDNHLQLWYYTEADKLYHPFAPTDSLSHEEDGMLQIGIKNDCPFDGSEWVEHEKLYLKYFTLPLDIVETPTAKTLTSVPADEDWLKHMLCTIPDNLFLDAVYEALKLKGMAIKMAEKLKEDGFMEMYDYDIVDFIQNNDVDMRWRDIKSLIEHNNCEDKCTEEYVNDDFIENYLDNNSVCLSWSIVKDIINESDLHEEATEEYGSNIEELFDTKSESQKREILCNLINNL